MHFSSTQTIRSHRYSSSHPVRWEKTRVVIARHFIGFRVSKERVSNIVSQHGPNALDVIYSCMQQRALYNNDIFSMQNQSLQVHYNLSYTLNSTKLYSYSSFVHSSCQRFVMFVIFKSFLSLIIISITIQRCCFPANTKI